MDLINKIPPLLTDNELINALSKCPPFDSSITLSKSERLIKLLDLYDLFIPTQMSVEIYNSLYFALIRSFNRKRKLYDKNQMIKNRKIINGGFISSGVNGGDCSLIVGSSGIGKSQSIARAIEIITNQSIIEIDNPYCSIIPIMVVEASPNISVKGFFFDILRTIDNTLGTTYYQANNRSTVNTDSLLGAVANALLLHCGVLVVDEIDRLVDKKNSITFVNYITELINLCGISVIFCGVPKALEFFSSTEYLCRRSMGNSYKPMEYEEEYYYFCKQLFHYQYTRVKTELDSELLRTFYKYTKGVTAPTIQLFVNVQQWAINNDYEKVDTFSVNKALNEKMSIILPYISIDKRVLPNPIINEDSISILKEKINVQSDNNIFSTLSNKSNKNIDKAIDILQQEMLVEIIKI